MECEMKAERIFRAVAIAWHREKDLEGHQPKLRLLHLAESLGLDRRDYHRINCSARIYRIRQRRAEGSRARGWAGFGR